MSEANTTDKTRHEQLRQEYGTLNPHGRLMCSRILEEEVQRIVKESRAADGEIVRCGPGQEVTVELTFAPDDFPELWPWAGGEELPME